MKIFFTNLLLSIPNSRKSFFTTGTILLLLLLTSLKSNAQYSTTHYIAPSPWSYFDQYNEIVVTTISTTPVSVTIQGSDGTVYSNSLTTVSGTPLRYRFTPKDAVANYSGVVLTGQGLIISAASPIGVQVRNIASDYYTIAGSVPGDYTNCVQKGNTSFTSLGDQGQGTSFRVGYYANVSGTSCYSEGGAPIYGVMAVSNGTNVYLNNSLLTTLNAGQSYLFVATLGSLVTSNKNIVVNAGMRGDNSSGCADGVESQVIPTVLLGTTYIVVRSNGNTGYERSTIVATVANTAVTVTVPSTGITKKYTLVNAGDYVTINNGDGATAYTQSYITTTNPVGVFSGTADGCEIDMIVQPPLNNCAGSFNVQTTSFLNNANKSNAAFPYFGYVIIQSDTAIVYFNGTNLESIVGKRTAIGATGYYIIRYTNTQLGSPTNLQFIVNARINVALIESGAGYSMSAFISAISSVMPPPSVTSNCLPSILTAQGGFSSYQWYNSGTAIIGATSQTYSPSTNGSYSVTGSTASCGATPVSTAVLVNPKPNAGVDRVACAGTIATLTGTSTVTTASWNAQSSNPTGATLSSTNNGVSTVLFANSAMGSYNFIYDAGCTDTMKVVVKAISTSTTNATICSNSSYTFNGTTYTASGTYVAHLTNSVGCDSAATLNLTVKATSTSTKSISICTGSSYVFNGTTYTASGTYTAHLTNSVGCDSAATLVLTVNSTSTSTTNASICTGGSYTFNGTTYTTAGTYVTHLTNSVGCDSAASLVLAVKSPSTSSTSASICSGSSYTFNGTAYTSSGTYVAHLTNAVGCDSAATLVLTVKANTTSTTNASIVSGNSYVFNGTTYAASGTYTKHLNNSAGCDSAATLVLTVTTLSSTSATICSGSSYLFNGTSYTISGTYTKHLTNSTGGDSVATLVLTVKAFSTSTTNVSICNGASYTFNGTSYTAAGSYTYHLTNSVGCDSAATLVLTVKSLTTSTTNASICNGSSYTFNGTAYTTAGTYTAHLTNAAGCDSAATLNLTVKSVSTSTTTASICSGSSYTFNSTAYTTAGTYTVHLTNAVGCDSAATLVLTVKAKSTSSTTASICSGSSYTFNGTAYTASGTYTVHFTNAVGCDSAATLVLTVNANPTVAAISGNAAVCAGSTTTYTNTTTGGVWTSGTPSAASIDGNGLITGINAGSSTITYTVTSAAGCTTSVTKSLTVNSVPAVTDITGTNSTCVGSTTTLSNGSMGGTWSSSKTNVATVNTSGVVTGIAAGNTTISYTLSSSAGCSTTATMVVTVGAATTSITNASICSGSSYFFNGTTYTTAGSYVTHLYNSTGCDSAATLVLTVKSLSTSTTNASICNGSSYTFNGTTYTTAGSYTAHLTNAVGCDSAATLALTVKSLSSSTTNISICNGGSYTFNGSNYTAAGTYTSHLINSVGCDSAATLVLTVKALSASTTNASICNGSSYTFNGTTYITTGTYTAHLTNAVGCDSTATLVLTVKSLSTSTTNASICSGSSYTFNGTTYTTAGSYTAHLTNAVGCDSAATLVLTVKALYTSTTNVNICNGGSYTFNGTNYSTAGSYTAHLTNSVGCDSAATLVLTVKSLSTSTTNASICNGGSYTFNGTTYTNAGSYTAHLINSVGCDSAATLVLTVKSLSTSTTNASICSGSSYTFNGTAYTTAGSYTAHLTNSVGCDSAATLVLTVKSLSTSTTNASICSGSSYTFNGTTYTTAGTYTAHLTNAVGCDSAATLVLTVKSLSTSTTNASICNGGSYTFNGTAYTTAGSYTSHLINSVGCDSAATLVLTVKSLSTSTTNISICSGGSYTFNGTVYTTAGSYTAHFINSVGCDSAATLVLTVKSLSTSTTNISICNGGSYTFNGTSYSAAGTYTVHLINSVGCDSAATLVLTVMSLSTSTTNASICNGGSYTFNGTSYSAAGTYIAHLTNSVGCDSAATLLLTVKNLSTSTTNASICNGGSYTFNGTVYTKAGTYTAHLTNSVGCDSAATLVLTVKANSLSSTTIAACSSYSWNGTTYTTTGIYTYHSTNAVGCDSTATLQLTINQPTTSSTNITACSSYVWNGTVYTTAGTYTAHLTNSNGCDSTATLHLAIALPSASTTTASVCAGSSYLFNGFTYSAAGTYIVHLTNAAGCDSVVTLILSSTNTPTVAPIIGSPYVCGGSTIALSDATGGGVWSSAKPIIAPIDAFGIVTGNTVGTATINYKVTNACGSTTVKKDVAASTTKPSVQAITGTSAVCVGDTTRLSNPITGGVWTIDNTSIAYINNTTGLVTGAYDGTTTVNYTLTSIYGCTATVNVPLTVNCGSVTSGGEGGLESKSLGNAVAKRVYNKALANTDNTLDYSKLLPVNYNMGKIAVMGIATPGTITVTDLMPSREVIGSGYNAYDVSSSLVDLPTFTNAQVVKAYNYVSTNLTKSAALISRTYRGVYLHTKPICDRLKGATLLDVQQITNNGLHFIQYKLLQSTGQVEYAISFSAGVQQNSDTFKLQSIWLTKNYIGLDTMYNFQLWAVTPDMARNMLTSVLQKLANQLPLQQINEDFSIPRTYISNITRNGNKLALNINNTTTSTNASLQLAIRKNENEPSTTTQKVDVTLLPNASTHVEVDINDIFENDVNLFVEGKLEDLAYTNDGNWNYSLSNKSADPNSFVVNNDEAIADTGEFRLFRNVSINVNTPDYVSIYKIMKAGGLSRDLSNYTNLLFNAAATGAGQLKIVLQKASVSNWADQYSYTLPISADAKDYVVKLKDFISATNKEALKADDIVTITFSFIGNGGNNITASLANVRFNHIDYVYETSLSDKSLNVYPNPVKDNFTCSFRSDKQAIMTLQLVEIGSGRVVLTKAVDVVKGANNIAVQVNRLLVKQGQYVLMIANEGERYTPFKLQMRQY